VVWLRSYDSLTYVNLPLIHLFLKQVYLFQLSTMCNNQSSRFPLSLKVLLEHDGIKKVGNRICSDVSKLKGWNVTLKPTVELGHIMYDRGLVPNRAPSLETIIDSLFPGVELDGKHDGADGPRLSDWSAKVLTDGQIFYSGADGYGTAVSWRASMQYMNPRVQARSLVKDVIDGMAVTLYANRWKGRVVEGTIRGLSASRTKVIVEIDLQDNSKIHAAGTIVEVVVADDQTAQVSIASLQQQVQSENSTSARHIYIQWPLYFCRRTIDMSGSDTPITINTVTRQVAVDFELDGELQMQNIDANCNSDSSVSRSGSSEGENDRITTLPRSRRRRMNHYRCEKVKNDIVHIFFRFQKVLSKEHGAYFSFMTALRDAFYIVNQHDLDDCCQVLREKHHLSESDICRKMKYDYDWFLRRIRRHVPEPPVLEQRYMAVFESYKDIRCAKTGLKLFGTKEAMAAHQSALKHIRRNCLSDMPFESYYSPIREDRHGLTINHCHRGTPGNEGLHQKLRQIVRGFSNSPRLMFAMLTDFFLVWNQNIDIAIRGLPDKYKGLYYCGDLLEEEIEKMARWKERSDPPHPDWVSTRSVQSSDETFGFLTVSGSTENDVADDNIAGDADVSVCSDAAEAADELLELDDEINVIESSMASELPPSSQWMAFLHNKFRPFGKVMGNVEWEYFKDNVTKFQRGAGREADNYCSIQFSVMAESWNKWVDSLGTRHPEVTYKTAAYLKEGYKSMKRRALQSATLRLHVHTLNKLKEMHTNEDTNRSFDRDFPRNERAAQIQPTFSESDTNANRSPTHSIHEETNSQNDDNDNYLADS
jgi:hypothetical protein